jgi:hypothetical protein
MVSVVPVLWQDQRGIQDPKLESRTWGYQEVQTIRKHVGGPEDCCTDAQ